MKSRNSGLFGKRRDESRSALRLGKSVLRKAVVENLENRELLSADGFFYPPIGKVTAYLPPDLSYAEYAARSDAQYGGGRPGLSGEGSLGFSNSNESEPNNTINDADFLPLGTGDNDFERIAVSGNLAQPSVSGGLTDEDYFAFDLRAGDILDANVLGSLASGAFDVSILDANRREVIGNNGPITTGYPVPDSPLSTNVFGTQLAFVVPATGRYYARVSDGDIIGGISSSTSYTLTLSVSRPALESEPIGTVQKIFLDFDGELLRREIFGATGTARLSPLSDFIVGWGLQPSDESRIIDKIIDVFESKFYGSTAITGIGGNGDFFATGNPGEFALEILNSRDHADPWGDPNVSRIIIGGTQAELLIPTIGIAQSIDVGNFDTEETAVTLLDNILPLWGPIPRAANVPLEDILVDAIASVSVHEAGHFFSSWHTINTNAADQIMDTGGNLAGLIGVGLDGIYGTPDDVDVQFGTDRYDAGASFIPFGNQNGPAAIAWGLASGRAGSATVNGVTFEDRNVNRTFDGSDSPLANIRIYADLNNNGIYDGGEFTTLSDANGNYQLFVPAGTHIIREVVPAGFRLTSPVDNARTVTVSVGQNIANQNFGQERLNTNLTGSKWNDINANGLRDAGEGGIEGVFIYIDLDGDNRIDIGEPSTRTDQNGNYKLNFPGAGTFTIREVVDPGYVQTFPGPDVDNEHTVVLTGDPAVDRDRVAGLNFGNTLTVDFGDAPASYGVASHGFVPGLRLGANWDAEQSSLFSSNALGDDASGAIGPGGSVIDDEDGVVLSRPLVAGSSNNRVGVGINNTTGVSAYLQGWVDYNQDGDFTDAGEQIISNQLVASGVTEIVFSAPANASLGSTFARFRLANTQNVPSFGSANSGEVEDYVFSVVDSLNLAVDDRFTVSRNSVQNTLDVLENDFRLPGETLEIVNTGASSAGGIVQISNNNTILYTPPNGFIGQDVFQYTMINSGGERDTASVVVDVNLFFEDPLAIDDSFDLATNAIDFPLNVLANDIEGQDGALTIISVTQPDKGGQINIATGGKSVRYTPVRGFGGTEVFTYTVADAAGKQSIAQVTLHTLPGDRADDDVLIQFVTTDLSGTPITAIQQGQRFKVDVIVDDLRFDASNPGADAGVFAAYTDLLYNLQLVSTVAAENASDRFSYEVDFLNFFDNFQTGDATVPGIIDEFGAFSSLQSLNAPGPVRLASITFEARSPGIARFTPDPADDLPNSDTLLFNTPGSPVPFERIRYLGTSLEIVGDGTEFPVAVDDSLPTSLPAGSFQFPINVLANDRPGSQGPISIVDSSDGLNGTTTVDTRGTATPTDDRILYTPNGGFNGADQFTYTIQDSRGIQSSATVTLRVGNADENDIVSLNLVATDLNGSPIDQITVGSQFQIRGFVQDLRTTGTDLGVFAAYEDVLYSSNLVSPVSSNSNDPDLGFEVSFGANYQRVREGDIRTPGLINELGAVSTGDLPLGNGEQLLFIVTMTANSVGQASFIADPADISPLHDTLTYEPVTAVGFDLIRYGFDTLNIVSSSGGGSGEGFTNWNNRLDVNNDGFVSPIDALGVINSLNAGGSGPLSGGGSGEGEDGKLYVDTSADGSLSPIDALLVINFLNSNSGSQGEGEAPAEVAALQGIAAPLESLDSSDDNGSVLPDSAPVASLGSSSGSSIGSRMTDYSYGPSLPEYFAATDSFFDEADEEDDSIFGELSSSLEESLKPKFR